MYAVSNVDGNGVSSGLEESAVGVRAMLDVLAVGIHTELGELISVIVIVAVVVDFIAVYICIQCFVSDPVILDGVQKLSTGNFLFFEDQLLYRGETVADSSDSDALRAGKVVFGSAHRNVFAVLYASVHDRGKERKRTYMLMCDINCVQK